MLTAGERVGSFEIVESIGAGGMGLLFRARDSKLRRDVAIKVLSESLVSQSEHMLRFVREARAASALNHPNIVTIHEIGDHNGTPFIAMELIEGRTLRDLLGDRSVSMRRLISLFAQIARGLAAAHSKGIVHRDLKPENVMITRDGFAKILDFGLAKSTRPLLKDEESTARLELQTDPGMVLGTIGYMSPEQARGLAVDYHSDQFSFGSILYEALAGVRAFSGRTPLDALSAIINSEPKDVTGINPNVPQPLEWTLRRCLRKEPEQRYASTDDLAQELESIAQRLSESTGVAPLPHPGSGKWWIAAVAATVVAFAGFLTVRGHSTFSSFFNGRPAVASNARAAVIVLPFADLSGREDGALIGEGFAETVGARLASVDRASVLPTNGIDAVVIKDDHALIRQTGADILVRGSLQRLGDRVRVTYAVVDRQGRQLAKGRFDGSNLDLFDLQDRVAAAAIDALGWTRPTAGVPGDSQLQQDRYLEALGHLRRTENPASVDAAIRILESMGNSPTALSTLARAYHAKFIVTMDRRWAQRAMETADKAWKSDPDSFDAMVTRGQTSLLLGELDSAEKAFNTVIVRNPSSFDAVMGLGRTRKAQGKLAEAERLFRRGVDLQPENWNAHNSLGTFRLRNGRFAEAVKDFERALSLTPDNVLVLNNLGVTYQQMGRDDEAIETYQRSIAVRPNADAFSNLGTVQFSRGDYGESVRTFQRATALNPEAAVLWMNLGDACRWSKNCGQRANEAFARAIEILSEDLTVRPNDASTHSWLALCAVKTGRTAEAIAHARRSIALGPADPYITYQAAVVFEIAGQRQKALESLAAAMKNGYPKVAIEADPELGELRKTSEFATLRSS